MNYFKTLKINNIIAIVLFVIMLFSVFVRIQGLGYSNFQGDEVNPMDFLYEMDNGVLEYLFTQKRGPVQYVINMINVGLFGYQNEAQIRVPFLMLGIGAIFTIYLLTKKVFGKTTGFLAAVFMAVNGLFIAFSRITQYQAFMYFLIPIGILIFINAVERKDNIRYLISGLIMSLAFLAHYDTLSVVPFFVAGFLGLWYRDVLNSKEKLSFNLFVKEVKKYIVPGLLFFSAYFLPALAYYIPFYTGQAFEASTSGYLENRLFGGGFMPRTEITLKLLAMYAPRYHWYGLFLLGFAGIVYFYNKVGFGLKLNIKLLSEKFVKVGYLVMTAVFLGATIFSFYPIKPRSSSLLVIGSAVVLSMLLIFSKKLDWKKASLAVWFLGAYSFYFFIMKDPRTHVYVSILPLFALAGYGTLKIYTSLNTKLLQYLFGGFIIAGVILTSIFNWVVFVDRSPEYPWWDKDYLPGVPAYRIDRVRHKKIEGVFGFNNYRGWEQVKELYDKGCLVGDFNSNEKNSITYFYVRQNQKKGDLWEVAEDSDNLVLVNGPHSWMYMNTENFDNPDYTLLKVIESNGYPVTYIYGKSSIYPDGKLLCQTK